MLFRLSVITLLGSLACGDSAPPETSAAPELPASESPATDPDPHSPLNSAEDDLPEPSDDSEEPLEARCFNGDRRACDQLGH